jgi:hypothetical protein
MRMIRHTFLAFLPLFLLVVPGLAEEEMSWFDLENCAICSKLDDEEGLIESLHWEAYVISDGMLSVTMIPEAHEEAFLRAAEQMEGTLKELESGEPKPICGFCRSYGALVMAGARVEELDTRSGHISLITSTDPAVVTAIHKHARRAIQEAKRVLESVAARRKAGGPSETQPDRGARSERGPRGRSSGASEAGGRN